MHCFRTIIIALVKPVIVMLSIGVIAAILAPIAWNLIDGQYALTKVFQKTGLALLTLSAIIATRTTENTTQFGRQKQGTLNPFRRIFTGWLIGILSLSVPLCTLIILDQRIADTDALASTANIIRSLTSALLAGLLIGLIEETIFRGWLLGWLQKKLKTLHSTGTSLAVVISAFYFSLLHFLKPDNNLNNHDGTLFSGIDMFVRSLKHVVQHNNADALIALFLAGVFLGLLKVLYDKGLTLVIGIHAGWVFSIKVTKALTDPYPSSQWQYLVSQDGITGYLSAGWLAVLILTLLVTHNRSRTKER